MKPDASASTRREALALAALTLAAFGLRALASVRAGPLEGGGDEWYSAFRALSALAQRGNPGDFMHPALGYLLFAAACALRVLFAAGSIDAAPSAPPAGFAQRALEDFVSHERAVLQTLQTTSAFVSALTVPATYALARRVGATSRGALAAAAALALARLHLEYGQRVRVDALFSLCTTVALTAVLGAARDPRLRAALVAGALVGLAVSANYPGTLLCAPLVWACARGARGQPFARAALRVVCALACSAAAYLVTNPYLLLRFADARRGFAYQLAYATRVHPGQAPPSLAYYVAELAAQGSLFLPACAAALAWALARRNAPHAPPVELARPLALCALGYIAVFALLRTQFDRYVLPAIPWLCALLGPALDALAARTSALAHRWPARAPWLRLAPAALTLVVLYSLSEPALRAARQEAPPGPPDARGELQRWLLGHAGAGEVLWLQADRAPLLQALYADAPDALEAQDPVIRAGRAAVARSYPRFGARVLKGEFVERIARVRPEELASQRVSLVLACPESHRASRDPRRPPPAYDELLREAARVGTVLYTPGNECVVLRLR